jgi:hypothetical protein
MVVKRWVSSHFMICICKGVAMTLFSLNLQRTFLGSLLLLLVLSNFDNVHAESVSLLPAKDNTLFEYDPADMDSPFNSNGAGDFFSAGRTRSRGLLRRGLLQFDFSSIPDGAVIVPGTVELRLVVVDSPRKDKSGEARDFWLVPVEQDWGEGSSEANAGVSNAGSGAAATSSDATWLHSIYDPNIHDPRLPNAADNAGYWSEEGVIGNLPSDPSIFGSPAGSVPAAPYLGPVTFASMSMETHINGWLVDSASNFGWLVVGDERIVADDVSSARAFASREHASAPTLSFQYTIVPEPASAVALLAGCVISIGFRPGAVVLDQPCARRLRLPATSAASLQARQDG